MTLDDAIALATTAHAGQVDKSGRPYIDHVLRVAGGVRSPDERMTAVLHDVVEDTTLSLDDLQRRGCSDHVVEAIDALTRREGEVAEDYYGRVAANPIALAVKRADLADNSDPSRLAELPGEVAQRLREKYAEANRLLGSA